MINKICAACGREYFRKKAIGSTNKFCSADCRYRFETLKAQSKLINKRLKESEKMLKVASKIASKTSKKLLAARLWKLVSRKVRASSDRCYTCDKPLEWAERSAGHFWPKGSHGSVRYDLDNLRNQCNPCNLYKSGNLAEYAVRLRREIGDVRFDALAERAHTIHRFTTTELQEMIAELENEIQ